MHNISVDKLLKLKNINIIDIRSNIKYLSGHIPNSINIYEKMLIDKPDKFLNKNDIYYIYCQSGYRSNYVVNILNNLGYNCVNIIGGYNNYVFRKI